MCIKYRVLRQDPVLGPSPPPPSLKYAVHTHTVMYVAQLFDALDRDEPHELVDFTRCGIVCVGVLDGGGGAHVSMHTGCAHSCYLDLVFWDRVWYVITSRRAHTHTHAHTSHTHTVCRRGSIP